MDEILIQAKEGPNHPSDPVDETPAESTGASLTAMDAKLDLILSALGIDMNEVKAE